MINRFFPTLIGLEINPHNNLIENKLSKKCFDIEDQIISGGKNWVSNTTYNTIGKYNIFKDDDFKDVNDFVLKSIDKFCDELKIDKECIDKIPNDAWFNIYREGDYQEYHHHGNSVLSVVYFLKVPKNPAKIFFKSPVIDMIPLSYKNYTPDTFERIHFEPQPGMLLIFRSHLEHCVEKQTNKDERISLAYNFRRKYERT